MANGSLAAGLRPPPATDSGDERGLRLSGPVAVVLSALALAAVVCLSGLRYHLPYAMEMDEYNRVVRAITMAVNWDPNPHWFGHPGSTMIYPLALLYRFWSVALLGGPLWGPDAGLLRAYEADFSAFFLLGRLLSVGYLLMSYPLAFQVGRRLFGPRVAAVAVVLSLAYEVAISHAQIARTDASALFFALLSFWLALRFYDRPTPANRVLAGVAVGLAMASRYYMLSFLLPVLIVDAKRLWEERAAGSLGRRSLLFALAGPVAAAGAFIVATPFFLLDLPTAISSLRDEARTIHPGADGLSPLGNLLWYLRVALPDSLTWPQALLALGGVALAVWRRQREQVFLACFVLVFLVGLSLHGLHWQRWTIQVLPFLAMFAAMALVWLGESLSRLLRGGHRAALLATALLVGLVVAQPAYDLTLYTVRQANPDTRLLAREWLVANLPAGSRVVQELYAAPLSGTSFRVEEHSTVAGSGASIAAYRARGFDYLIVSEGMYTRYMADPARYPAEVAVYEEIFRLPLVQEFAPSPTRGGPTIRIYKLAER